MSGEKVRATFCDVGIVFYATLTVLASDICGAMVQIFAQDPNTNPYIMVDPFNEPDYFNMRWETQNGVVGAADRYIAVYDSIHNVNPDVMLVFEGLGQVT